MKFSFLHLKEFLATKKSAQEIGEILNSLGIEVDALSSKEGDFIFEISLTPNLAHASNLLGIAKEISAVTTEKVIHPEFSLAEEGGKIESFAKVKVIDSQFAPRYMGRVIGGVKVAPSPSWLVKKLEGFGARSVNNVVDITNLVLFECGVPLHAFDLDKIGGKEVVVRCAKKGEKLVTLDGKEHFPTEEMLLICDEVHPLVIAGVMGGAESEVTVGTTNVFLEAAYFEPTQVRRTSKRLGIHTESSYRFERGIDPNALKFSLDYASALIQKIAGGKVAQGVLEASQQTFSPQEITCRIGKVNSTLGTNLARGEVEAIFKRAGLTLKSATNDTVTVIVPTHRVDLKEEIDLIEEVARLYGYDLIFENRKPISFTSSHIPDSPLYTFETKFRQLALRLKLQEFLTCDLISPEEASLVPKQVWPTRSWITLLNPSSVDQSLLRLSHFPNLLKLVKYNIDHNQAEIAGFEIGKIHFKIKDAHHEQMACGIVLTGKRAPQNWESKPADFNFFDLKGVLENLFCALNLKKIEWKKSNYSNFHPGQQASILIDGHECGIVGAVHPQTLKKVGIDQPVLFAEVSLDELMQQPKEEMKMQPLPQFPASTRDWTVTVAKDVSIGKIFHLIAQAKAKMLEDFSLLDVYQSEKLGSDWKNITLRFVYRDLNETISQKTVEEEHAHVLQSVVKHIKVKT